MSSIKNKANRAFSIFEYRDKKQWKTGDEITNCQRLHTKAINLALQAIDAGISALELDYYC